MSGVDVLNINNAILEGAVCLPNESSKYVFSSTNDYSVLSYIRLKCFNLDLLFLVARLWPLEGFSLSHDILLRLPLL